MHGGSSDPSTSAEEERPTLRLGNPNDAPDIHKLICCAYSDPKLTRDPAAYERITLPEVNEKMASGHFLVGVEHDPRINKDRDADASDYFVLGVCVFIDTSSASHLTEMNCLAVHPELQGSSLSLAVLDAAFALALKSGYSHVESDVLSIRPHLVAFYEKTGWVLTGERRAWPDRWTADLNPSISAAEAARLHMIMYVTGNIIVLAKILTRVYIPLAF